MTHADTWEPLRPSLNATRELASFVVRTQLDDLPPDLLHQARRCTVDCLGVALGATAHPSVQMLLDVVETLGGQPQATIWGTGRRSSITQAALVNGYQAHLLDYDDSYVPEITVLHGNAPIIPAALGVGEWRSCSGRDYLRAFVLGFEVAARIALSAGRAHYEGGWHVTATVGGFGATVAAGCLLGLDEQQLTYAFGIAGSQAAGVGQALGSMTKAFHPGRAAMSGVLAALLAQRGFTSGDDFLTGPKGFHTVYPSDQDVGAMVDDLGERWELRRAAFKPYACGVVVHPLLDALIALRQTPGFDPRQVVAVEVRTNPVVLGPTGKTEPRSGLEGKFSVYHSAAVALLDGQASEAQYTDQRVLDPAVVELRRKVSVQTDAALRKDEAYATIRLSGGRVLQQHVPHASGTAANPMSDDQLSAKFLSLAEPELGRERAIGILAAVTHLDELPSITALTELLQ
jgi:2-methylcitrate dehydratase PrpD